VFRAGPSRISPLVSEATPDPLPGMVLVVAASNIDPGIRPGPRRSTPVVDPAQLPTSRIQPRRAPRGEPLLFVEHAAAADAADLVEGDLYAVGSGAHFTERGFLFVGE